jgi:hypothetical protein
MTILDFRYWHFSDLMLALVGPEADIVLGRAKV